MEWIKTVDWTAWIGTVALIVLFRESAVWVTGYFGHPEMGNLLGLISLLIVLLGWRKFKKIPARLVDTNNKIMKESAFAFLPISAGSLLMMTHLGHEIPMFLVVLFVSTLIPLWVYAKMSKKWL
ncbi:MULTISPECIES: hypothetical protein [unclassified Acinetobacter]|uniref:hypothetical protein n=1 Tax=unclassified Acinetobacter TaxID=196816 RepID=UPI000A34C48C|nr:MULTISPECIES: hypothetical protein [unclassified Acinetobacter]OTG60435.1 hypothetical protein B9T36_07400 [Acinetobacter sp. ANC 4204]RGD90830.1 hypothetical protein DYI96_08840 [Acinetobacter sp. SWAC57]